MSQPTPAELALLRTRPHRSHLYLSIYQPKTVFAAQVNDSTIAIGKSYIIYDTVTTGSYSAIKAGMTLYVGSTLGGSEYGRIRVKSADGTALVVAENSDINWKDDLYLTIKDFYEVWPVYQALFSVGNTPSTADVLVYKDTDVMYAGQNDHPGSLIWMGSHKAGLIENGQAEFYWSATGTVNVSGESMTYSWLFEGGNPATSTSVTPGTVAYDTPGHYVTQLQVTASSGTVDTSYRYVSVYDDTNPPVQKWGISDLRGSRGEGAYTATIWIKEPVSNIAEGSLVVIFSDDQYGSTKQHINGSIIFVGYILNDTISYDYHTSTIEFDVGSVTEVMKLCEGPGISLTSTFGPDTWSEMQDINISKAIWFYLRWHTTVLNVADVMYTGPNYSIYSFETDAGNLYDVLNEFMKNTLFGSAISNRQGQIVCELDPESYENPINLMPLGMRIDRQDWMETPSVVEARRPPLSYLEAGGYAYNSSSGIVNTPFLACAPGNTPAYFGRSEEQQGLALTSQAHLNTLIGNVFAYRNARYPQTTLQFVGNYANIELVPSERYLLTVSPTDSQSRMNVTDLPIHPTELTWRYIPDTETLILNGVFHEMVTGVGGIYLPVPQDIEFNSEDYNNPYDPPSPPTGTIPWTPPWVPPVPPPTPDSCITQGDCQYNGENGPFLLYPERSTLDANNLSTYVYYPCIIRKHVDSCLYDSWFCPSTIVIDYVSNEATSGVYWGSQGSYKGVLYHHYKALQGLSTVNPDKSVIASYQLTDPVSASFHAIKVFDDPGNSTIGGFKLTLGGVLDPGQNNVESYGTPGANITASSGYTWSTDGKAMGFVEAQNNLTNWPYIAPWAVEFKVSIPLAYGGVSQARISVKKTAGLAERLVYVEGSTGNDFFANNGYNMHGTTDITNVNDIGQQSKTFAPAITMVGDYYFRVGTYWDDGFSPASHPSSYELVDVEIYYSGGWHSLMGTLNYPTVIIQAVYLWNICALP